MVVEDKEEKMGTGISILMEKADTHVKTAFTSTLVIGLVTHAYKFLNTLPNHDSVYNYYTDQNVVGSGRWFLTIACGFSSYFDLPWINGFLALIYIALTMAIITQLFQIKNRIVIVLCGGVLASFPAVTETFFFGFTADGYMLAMLLNALAVYLVRFDEHRFSRFGLSGLCLCLACAIYQAYVSFALILAICYLLYDLFEGVHTLKESIKWLWQRVIMVVIALTAYYIIWKICLIVEHEAVNDYQGINKVGTISLEIILSGGLRTLRSLGFFFLEWNIFEHGLTFYACLNLIFLVLLSGILVWTVYKSRVICSLEKSIYAVCLLLLMIPCSCMWHFVSDSVSYRPRMLQCLSVLYIFGIVLFERWAGMKWCNLMGLLMAVMVYNFVISANISYYLMQQCYEKSYAVGLEMVLRIREKQAENEVDRIAIVGSRLDYAEEVTMPARRIVMLASGLEEQLLFDQDHIRLFLNHTFDDADFTFVDNKELKEVERMEEVSQMGIWPANDAVQMVDDILVIKLSETDGDTID